MKIKKKTDFTLTLIFSLISLLLLITVPFLSNTNMQNYQEQGEPINKTPNSAGFWVLDFIHVDDNWTDTAGQGWCKEENGVYIIENVTIDAGGTGSCILIENTRENFLIQNCTLLNAEESDETYTFASIAFINVSNGVIFNNTLTSPESPGIYLHDNSTNNKILNNTATNGGKGIFLEYECKYNLIYGNQVFNNTEQGIHLEDYCDHNIISYNNIYNEIGGEQVSGLVLRTECFNNTLKKNIIKDQVNEGIALLYGTNNNTIIENEIKNNINGLYLNEVSNNTIVENKVYNNGNGMWLLSYSHENKIKENEIFENNYNGIYLSDDCDENVITQNDINDNAKSDDKPGILISVHCDYNTISKNHIFNNKTSKTQDDGIIIDNSCQKTTITDNLIFNHTQDGIIINDYSHNTSVFLNKIYNNSENGITLSNDVYNTTITKNIIKNNTLTGVDISDSSVKGNTIYFNCFKNNGFHARDLGAFNHWYKDSKGNYWDNYTGSDAGNDGIGDMPYNISKSPLIQDLYPLMECPDFTESEPILYSLSFEAFLSHGFKRAYKKAIFNAFIRAFERKLRRLAREHNITISTQTSLHANIEYNQNIPKQANSFSYFGAICSFTYILVESVPILKFLRKREFIFTQQQFSRFKYFI